VFHIVTVLFRFVVDYKELKVEERIGEGAFGIVHRGVWRSSPVAIKIMKNTALNQKQKDEFMAEIELMQRIRPHQNVVNVCVIL
jgi:serine/threonine protein kinase